MTLGGTTGLLSNPFEGMSRKRSTALQMEIKRQKIIQKRREQRETIDTFQTPKGMTKGEQLKSLPMFLNPQYGQLLENSKIKLKASTHAWSLQNNDEDGDIKKKKFYQLYKSEWIGVKLEE